LLFLKKMFQLTTFWCSEKDEDLNFSRFGITSKSFAYPLPAMGKTPLNFD